MMKHPILMRGAALVLAAAMTLPLAACGEEKPSVDVTAYQGQFARTVFNESLDLSEIPVEENQVPDDFSLTVEAEDGTFVGNVVEDSPQFPGFTGRSYVSGFQTVGEDFCKMTVEIETSGTYDLTFSSCCGWQDAEKYNYAWVDGQNVGEFYTGPGQEFMQSTLTGIYLEAGTREISVSPYWGYILLDSVTLTKAETAGAEIYDVPASLNNPNASVNAKRLMQFMADVYGKYTISGQYCDEGATGYEIKKIEDETGEKPAILGLDMMDYTPSRIELGGTGRDVTGLAIDWYYNHGGIVTMCWHWNAPTKYLYNNAEHPWYSGFSTGASSLDLDKIMNGEDQEGYDLLMADIDAIATAMQTLAEADVPVLWRPLHEASGGWFWWGDCDPESYQALWNLLYDKMTNEYQLNNLIWVWNGQDDAWYPGDETVDMIGEDIYPGEKVYTSQADRFCKALDYTEANKIITMSENGCMFDPDLAFRDNARWSWFCIWSGEFIMNDFFAPSEQYTEFTMWDKVYQHERVLTLDEMPCLWLYPYED